MYQVGVILQGIILFAIFLFIARIVVDWVQVLAPRWRSKGILAAVLEVLYSITDPPLNAIRRVIPPIRLGQVMLDLSPMIVLVILWVASAVVGWVFLV